MTNSNNLNIPLVAQSQAQKEVTINEAICTLEALQNRGAIDKDLATPPVSPVSGDTYIIAAAATGVWSGKAEQIAYYNGVWKFIEPKEGLLLWVNDEDKLYCYDGSDWVAATASDSMEQLGINATADSTNKLSISTDAALFSHNGSDVRIKVNKDSSADTASILYQDNFSGRAEIGLCGDDDFHFKVSPNGSTWYNAITISKTDGRVSYLYPNPETTYKTTADTTNSSNTSYVAVDGLSFTLEASRLYLVEFYLAYVSGTTATGIDVSLGLPAGASIIAGDSAGANAATVAQTTQLTGDQTSSASLTATYSTSVNSLIKMTAIVNSGVSGGVVQPYFRAEVNAVTLTIKQNSVGRLTCIS